LALTERAPDQSSTELLLFDVASGRSRRLLQPRQLISSPRFSPDGRWIAFNNVISYTHWEICMIPASGGSVHCATRHPTWLNGFAWTRDSQSLIAMSALHADHPEIWQFPMDGLSEPRRLATFDFGQTKEISMARGRGSVAWVRDLSTSSIWGMSLDEPDRAPEL